MNTQGIKRDDIVHCNVRGDEFYAIVQSKGRTEDARLRRGELMVKPTERSAPRIVTARQIKAHYRKSRLSSNGSQEKGDE